jgi:acyl carrier protein
MMDEGEVLRLIAAALDCPPSSLTMDSALGLHPAWTSLGQLSILMELEQRFGIAITDETIRENQTARGVFVTCQNSLATKG